MSDIFKNEDPRDYVFAGQPLSGPETVGSYPILSGREIYDLHTITGLNRSPIGKLSAYVLAGETVEGVVNAPLVNIKPSTIVNHLLVDGSFAIFLGSFLKDIVYINESLVITNIRNDEGLVADGYRRMYMKFDNAIIVVDQELVNSEWKTVDEFEYTSGTMGYKDVDEMFLIYPNDRGLLYYNQKTFFRLEEIERTIKNETDDSSLSTVISGNYTGNMAQAQTAFDKASRSRKKKIWLPGDINVHNIFNGDAVDKMIMESAGLLILYREAMFDYISPETVAMSGISRRLAMLPTIQYTSIIRKQVTELYLEHGVVIEFETFSLIDSTEKEIELRNIEFAYEKGAITDDEYHLRIRTLMSFK